MPEGDGMSSTAFILSRFASIPRWLTMKPRNFPAVIYVHLHGRSYLLLEHPIHQPLVGSSCVLESKRHHTITIGSLPCDEQGLFLVIWVHADLIVAGEDIHKTEEFMASSGIYDEVDSR